VNEELLGSATDDKAGVLSMLRQGAGLTTLQRLFDQLDHSQKLLGSLMIDIIQTNFAPGKVKRILGGEEPSEQFYNKAFGTYGAAIEEGLNTTTQKQMQFAQLLHLKELGIPIPNDTIVNAATLQNKKELIDAMKAQEQQQQQMQEQQMQMQMAQGQAQIKLSEARAAADQGLGIERVSRVQENEALAVERKAEAEKDHYLGLLDAVKALKEIEHLDLAHVEKLITLSNLLKSREAGMETQEVVRGSNNLAR
jgi:hypothetical protein